MIAFWELAQRLGLEPRTEPLIEPRWLVAWALIVVGSLGLARHSIR